MKSDIEKKRGLIFVRANIRACERLIDQIEMCLRLSDWIKLCHKTMKNENVIEVHTPIIDLGFGVSSRRTRLEELKSLVKSRKIDFLYVYDLSRRGRNVTEVFELLQTFKESGVEVKTIGGGVNFLQESLSANCNIDCSAIA